MDGHGQTWLGDHVDARVGQFEVLDGGNAEQLRPHLGRARDSGVNETELLEPITHLAF